MLLLITLLQNRNIWNIIVIILAILIYMVSSKVSFNENSYVLTDKKSGRNGNSSISCDRLRSRCDKLYTRLSTMEEDCPTYRIYLGCLQILRSSNSFCQANLYFWLILSTTEKLIKEKCSSGDISAIEPPRDLIFSNSVSSRNIEEEKNSHFSPCLDSIQTPDRARNEYYICSLFGHPNLLLYSGERQTCRLQGAWPLINNRFLTIQITGQRSNRFHFHDSTSSTISQISVLIKPDGKCISDFGISKLIYIALSDSSLPVVLMNGRKEIPQTLITIKPVFRSKIQERVELWLGHINTRIIIIRTEVADGEFTLAILVSLPLQVSIAHPRSRQQNMVRELCSTGCPAPESIDDWTLLQMLHAKSKNQSSISSTATTTTSTSSSSIIDSRRSSTKVHSLSSNTKSSKDVCQKNNFKGLFFDICYLMTEILISTNLISPHPSQTLKSLENYITSSIEIVQKYVFEFSHIVSVNFSFDLSPRTEFIPFRPLWKIRSLESEARRSSKFALSLFSGNNNNVAFSLTTLTAVLAFFSTDFL